MMFTEILMLLFSLIGLIFGIALTYIAPEELNQGKKYFILLKRLLFILISLVVFYYYFLKVHYLLLFIVLLSILFIVDFKTKIRGYYALNYLLFVLAYFLNSDPKFHLILASLIFLYGFPVGMLLRVKS